MLHLFLFVPIRVYSWLNSYLISAYRHKLRFHNTAEDVASGYDTDEIAIPYYGDADNIVFCHKLYYLLDWGVFGYTNGGF